MFATKNNIDTGIAYCNDPRMSATDVQNLLQRHIILIYVIHYSLFILLFSPQKAQIRCYAL